MVTATAIRFSWNTRPIRHATISFQKPPTTWPAALIRSRVTLSSRRAVLPGMMPKRNLQTQIFWLPPLMFVGLLGGLWIWKCAMMIVFQNKIIYMPGMPPNARRERIEDYARLCGGVRWEEHRIRAEDGTDLALCVASTVAAGKKPSKSSPSYSPITTPTPGLGAELGRPDPATQVYILYFQGNASSLPPRLQDFSWVLRDLEKRSTRAVYTMVCLSYRGYWTSRGRPSEKGINLDAQAALEYISKLHRDTHGDEGPEPLLVLWGQSVGSGFATNLAAWPGFPASANLQALVLETVFTSTRAMLAAVYPPKWAPYRYLWPFLRNHLDSLGNLDKIAAQRKGAHGIPHITIVEAGRDELVPADHGAQLYQRGLELGLSVEKKTVAGAFHNDVMFKGEGRRAVADAIEKAAVAGARGRNHLQESKGS